MCFVLFAASAEPLPLIAWNRERRAFNVSEPSPAERCVRIQFSHPHVHYLGSHIRCGCGFRRLPAQGSPVVDEAEGSPAEIEASHRGLYHWVRHALDNVSELEIYGCWWGEFQQRSRRVKKLHWSELRRPDFAFRERELLRVGRWLPRA